jgi:Holliday junction resolvasome RuvABC endonuclease subunit
VKIIGVDLGVRSVHIASDTYCWTIEATKSERAKELQFLSEKLYLNFIKSDVYAYVEEPVVAGARNLRTSLQIAQVCGVVLSVLNGELVPVSSWKKGTVGKGNAKKEDAANWLQEVHPVLHQRTKRQDHIDATCIRLYGLGQTFA